jgi:hypothetical protein
VAAQAYPATPETARGLRAAAEFERDGDVVFHAAPLYLLFGPPPCAGLSRSGCFSNVPIWAFTTIVLLSPPNLQPALEAGPVHFSYPQPQGHPLTSGTLKDWLDRGAKTSGLPDKLCSPADRKAPRGDMSPKEIARYTAAADQRL